MRTLSRTARAAALGVVVAFIALHDAVAADRVILVFGDSLSAGYGLQPEQGWVALLAQRLRSQGYGYQVVNASVSGETSEGGLTRLPRALRLHQPALVMLELGANDGLRGLPLAATQDNLARMIQLARSAGARVLLLGIRIPPNYGPRYTQEFAAVFPALAKQYASAAGAVPARGGRARSALMQDDGLHPNARGEPRVLETVWPYLQPLLKKNTATGGR